MSVNMDYKFYTPPNTNPNIDTSFEFDPEVALLEGQHYMATQDLARLEASGDRSLEQAVRDASSAGETLSMDDLDQMRSAHNSRLDGLRTTISSLEDQIKAAHANATPAGEGA